MPMPLLALRPQTSVRWRNVVCERHASSRGGGSPAVPDPSSPLPVSHTSSTWWASSWEGTWRQPCRAVCRSPCMLEPAPDRLQHGELRLARSAHAARQADVDEQNFAPSSMGSGAPGSSTCTFPATYDAVDGETQKIPLHLRLPGGGSQTPEAMITGKWEESFDQDYAFAIPLAGADPCENPGGNGKSHWMQAGMALPHESCRPELRSRDSSRSTAPGSTRTYWNASLPATFTDVLFVEELRAMLLARFPKLNAEKVYATGFSSGGGMTYMLACYRASLFRGFSVVAKTLGSDSARGDYDTGWGHRRRSREPGRDLWQERARAAGHATGIVAPQIVGDRNTR